MEPKRSQKSPQTLKFSAPSGYPFWIPGRLFGYLFLKDFRVPSRNDCWTILDPKRPPKGRALEVHLGTISENTETLIFETPDRG